MLNTERLFFSRVFCLLEQKLEILTEKINRRKKMTQNMIGCACNFSTREVEAGISGVQGHPWQHTSFNAILGYTRPCLNLQAPKKFKRKKKCMYITSDNICVTSSHIKPFSSSRHPVVMTPGFQN